MITELMRRSRSILSLFIILVLFGSIPAMAEKEKSEDERIAEIRKEIEEKGWEWTAGKTSVSGLSKAERMKLCGYIPPSPEMLARIPVAQPAAPIDLPTSFDWRNYGGVTAVKNQGGCGSCWAFAATGQLESHARIYDERILDLSEQAVMSCNTYGAGCNGGWMFAAYEVFMDYGAVSELCMPYEAGDGIPCIQDQCEPQAKISGYTYIAKNVDLIKQAVYENGPVATAFFAHDNLSAYTGGCYGANYSDPPNHAVLIVGWNDNLCSGEGAWIIKNSWGEGWGEDGYGYIKYGVCSIGTNASQISYIPSIVFVKVDTPNGGDTLEVDSEYDITWTISREVPDSLSVLLSLDSGAHYDSTIVTGLPGTATSYTWTVPELPIRTGRIRVVAYYEGKVGGIDESDTDFAIRGLPYLYVSPTGNNIYPYTLPRWAARSIQTALDASFPGDSIMVEGATYNSPVIVETPVLLYGGWNPGFTERDPETWVATIQSAGSPVSFMNLPPGFYGIEGFTITGGTGRNAALPVNGNYGGGVFSYNASPVIRNNIFNACGYISPTAFSGGGAIACYNGSVTVENNIISNCLAQSGGGIYLYQAEATIRNNRISGSLPHSGFNGTKNGGGIYALHSTAVIENNLIENNTMYNNGGGIYARLSTAIISSDTISTNACLTYGGGICCERTPIQITDCIIKGNSSSNQGGGIFHKWSSIDMQNTVIALNRASIIGGGMYADSIWGTISNNTVDRNTGVYGGGNFFLGNVQPLEIKNNMITYGETYGFQALNMVNITMQYNNLYGNTPADIFMVTVDSTNLNGDPHYADTASFDYHLALNSAGIDAGEPAISPDPDGSRNDIGAFGGPGADFSAPDFVPGLIASMVDDTTIKLAWTSPASGDLDYYAVYGNSNDGFTPEEAYLISTVPAGTDTFMHTPVSGCMRYRVNAVNTAGYAGGYSVQSGACTSGLDINPPEVTVIYPNGGEFFDVGDTIDVQWIAVDDTAVDSVSIWLSENGGTDFALLARSEPNDSIFEWIVPSVNSDSCLIKITAYDPALNEGSDTSDDLFTLHDPTGVGEDEEQEESETPRYATALAQNYPNPFNGVTHISYTLASSCEVSLNIYDLSGRLIAVLDAGQRGAGKHDTVWNGKDRAGRAVTSGVYFCRIKAGKISQSRKIVYLR